jgi:hypothetical protein
MKRRIVMKSLLALILSITLMAFTADAFAGENAYFAKDNEPLYGTWINMDYQGRPPQKIIINSDGRGGSSSQADSNEPTWRFKTLITGKWTDSEGNIMYKDHWVGDWGEEGYSLFKISNSGNTLEYVFDHDKYPNKIDSKHTYYRKYTRK